MKCVRIGGSADDFDWDSGVEIAVDVESCSFDVDGSDEVAGLDYDRRPIFDVGSAIFC